MKLPFRILLIAIALGLLIGVAILLGRATDTSSEDGLGIVQGQTEVGVRVGDTAPDFILEDSDGNTVQLSELRGQPVVLDFWAAWCPFCVDELPEIEASHRAYNNVVFLGIHRTSTETIEVGLKFSDELGVTYPILKDTHDDVYKTYTAGRTFMPVAFFIDKNGVISDFVFGPKTKEQMKERIEKLSTE